MGDYHRLRDLADRRHRFAVIGGGFIGSEIAAAGSSTNVESLIGPDTITTMPRATLDAFIDHGIARRTVGDDLDEAWRVVRDLAAAGIDLEAVADHLEADGTAAFARAYDDLLASVEARRVDIFGRAASWAGLIQASNQR